MPYNVPDYDINKISIGRGRLFINNSLGSTLNWVDIGAVRDAELTITRDKVEVTQGMPALKIATYSTATDVTFTITGIEWNIGNLANILGLPPDTDKIDIKTDINFQDVALIFVHQMPTGAYIMLSMYRAKGVGELTISFADDVHEIPYSFVCHTNGKDFETQAEMRDTIFTIERRDTLPPWFKSYYEKYA